MKKEIIILTLFSIVYFISLSGKAQEEKVIDMPSEVVDVFFSSDTIKMAEYIKNGKYPIVYRPKYKVSPLLFAARENRVDVAYFLIKNAGLSVTDEFLNSIIYNEEVHYNTFNSLLSFACHKNRIDMTDWEEKYSYSRYQIRYRLLVLYEFDYLNIIDTEERTKFYISIIENEDWPLLNLLDYSDDAFNGHTCYGPTVLTTAVQTQQYDLIKFLLDKGLDKNVRIFEACYDDAQEEESPYEIAENLGLEDIMELLDKYE